MLLLTFVSTSTLVAPHRHFTQNFQLRWCLCAFFSGSKNSSGSCQVYLLQLRQYLAGFPFRPLISWPPFLYLFTSCYKLAISLVSRVFVAANSEMGEVRVELVLTNSSIVVIPVDAVAARLSKQPSNSSIVTGVLLPPGVATSPTRASSTAPQNWSCPLAAWLFTLDCLSDFLYSSFHFPHVFTDLPISPHF